MPYGVSVARSRFVDELMNSTPSVFVDVPLDPAHVLVLQTGDGGDVTADLGGADAWFRDAAGEPSLKCFQNLNFMKAE